MYTISLKTIATSIYANAEAACLIIKTEWEAIGFWERHLEKNGDIQQKKQALFKVPNATNNV